ncbi:MAG TPA: hypothetical protein DCS48_03125 [Desulfovibrio sp.]|nr:hypothetical protein [Desulfovibrio sp.]
MFFLDAISGIFGKGGLGSTIVETVKDYFPPDMSEADKMKAQMKIKAVADRKEKEMMTMAMQADKDLTDRIAKLEGTAQDLKQLPVVGRFIIFARGCQRPLWGFATLYMDFLWFTAWKLTEKQETALCIINLLVLGFLFGERTIKNLEPLMMKIFGNPARGKS